MRHRFATAHSSVELNEVGLACVRITELLGDLVFDPARHVPNGVDAPDRGSTINRLTMVIDHEFQGSNNAKVRKLVKSVVPLTQALKHQVNPSKRDAAIACDGTISLVNIMRNIVDSTLS